MQTIRITGNAQGLDYESGRYRRLPPCAKHCAPPSPIPSIRTNSPCGSIRSGNAGASITPCSSRKRSPPGHMIGGKRKKAGNTNITMKFTSASCMKGNLPALFDQEIAETHVPMPKRNRQYRNAYLEEAAASAGTHDVGAAGKIASRPMMRIFLSVSRTRRHMSIPSRWNS